MFINAGGTAANELNVSMNEPFRQRNTRTGQKPVIEYTVENQVKTAENTMRIWQPTHFHCKTLDNLPRTIGHKEDIFSIHYLLEHEREQAYGVVQMAAECGLNVGMDEYDRSGFDEILSKSQAFSVRRNVENNLEGLIFIHPCLYCRSVIPCLGYFEIFLTRELLSRLPNAYEKLAKLATQLTNDMGRYMGVVTSLFTLHADWVVSLTNDGFSIIACFPFDGNLPKAAEVDSYLLHKKFIASLPEKLPTQEDCYAIARELTAVLEPPGEDHQPFHQLPFLPLRYTVQSCGLKTVWRGSSPADGRLVYKLCMQEADKSNGFAQDEFPTYEYFYHVFYKRLFGVVVEEESTGDFVMFMGTGDFWPSRRAASVCTDSMLIANKAFQGKGVAHEISYYLAPFSKALGYKGAISDTFMANIPMHEIQRKQGFLRQGYLPYSGRLGAHGFVDGVFSFLDVRSAPSFTEIVKTASGFSKFPLSMM